MSETEVTLHQGDCLALIPKLRKGSVSFIFADVPYGKCTQNEWDIAIDLESLWPAFRSVSKADAVQVFTAVQPFTTDLIASNRKNFRFDLVWAKSLPTGHLNAKRRPLRAHESILVFCAKGTHAYNPQMQPSGKPPRTDARIAVGSKNYGQQRLVTARGDNRYRYPTSILSFSNRLGVKYHPTQKPTALIEWLIKTYTSNGDTILDPCAGSGTTALAAINVGNRKVICIEKDAAYFEVMSKRVAEHKEKLRLK